MTATTDSGAKMGPVADRRADSGSGSGAGEERGTIYHGRREAKGERSELASDGAVPCLSPGGLLYRSARRAAYHCSFAIALK